MQKKRFRKLAAAFAVIGALCAGGSMTALAMPEQMPDGGVFDAEYYAEENPDVVAAVGSGKDVLYQHYTLAGKAEGRLPGVAFDAEYYAVNNPDVAAVLGNEEGALYQHYRSSGKAEGRLPSAPGTELKPLRSATPGTPAAESQVATEKKRLVKEQRYFSGGSLWYWMDYSYDSQGNLTKKVRYYAEYGGRSYVVGDEYSYDSQGNLTKQVEYRSDGSVRYEYSYDSQGNLTKQVEYHSDGSISSSQEYEYEYSYDSQGNKTKKGVKYYGSSPFVESEYIYDSQGNLTKEIHYNYNPVSGGVDKLKEYSYSYDSQGNMTKKNYYFWDYLMGSWEYSYDSYGNMTKDVLSVSKAGKNMLDPHLWEYSYDYDGFGNKTKKVYYEDGSSGSWTDYIYE